MTDTARAQRRPYGIACTACRHAKVKCVATSLEVDYCDRCIRLQRDCIFEPHRRGLWRREKHVSRSEEQGGPETAPTTVTWARPLQPASALLPSQGAFNYPSREEQSASASPENNTSSEASFTPQSFVMHSEDTRGLSLCTALDPDRVILGSPEGSNNAAVDHNITPALGQYDPIDLNIISRPSAQFLFEGFYTYFNCLPGLLDPHLYTFSYTRQRSSLLFSSLLTISARVFRPESYIQLRAHSESLLGKTLLACDSAIENIWSIVCMYYWKDVGDTRGYSLVGFALRMAVSADWNKTRRLCASDSSMTFDSLETEIQVRQRRDKDRVWLAISNLDRTSSYFTDRPLFSTPIAGESVSRGWLTLDKWTYPLGDGKAVAGFELTKIAQPVYDLIMKSYRRQDMSYSTKADNLAFRVALNKLNERLTEWGEYWPTVFTKFPGSEPWQVPVIHFFQDYMRLYFNAVLLHRILIANNNNPLHTDAVETVLVCYSSTLGVLRETVQLGKLDVLYYLWDTAHLMTAYAAMMLLKLMKQAKQVPGVCIEEGFKTLVEASAIYSTAASSLGSSHEQYYPAEVSAITPVAAQARLLSAIVFRARSEFGFRDPFSGPRNDYLLETSSTQLEPADSGPKPTNNIFHWNESTEPMALGSSLYSNDPPQVTVSQLTEEMAFSLESGFMDARFTDVGLLAWDEPGIFINPG